MYLLLTVNNIQVYCLYLLNRPGKDAERESGEKQLGLNNEVELEIYKEVQCEYMADKNVPTVKKQKKEKKKKEPQSQPPVRRYSDKDVREHKKVYVEESSESEDSDSEPE